MIIDYPFDQISKAILAHSTLQSERIAARLTHNVAKSQLEPLTLVHRLQFSDADYDRVQVLLTQFGLSSDKR